MIAIILCGGAATRYGGNKVLTVYKKRSLLEWNIRFCLANGIKDVRITTNEKYGPDISREIGKMDFSDLDSLDGEIQIEYQPTDKYGTAAALLPWIDYDEIRKDEFIVLFGDNYYDGIIDFKLYDSDCAATFKTFTKSKENLRLSFVEDDNTIIEKPHLYDEGRFFVGFMIFDGKMITKLRKLQPSRRGEYEITELFNQGEKRSVYPLNMHWFDITSKDEIEYV